MWLAIAARVGVRPPDFWKLTPAEFASIVKAHNDQERGRWYRAAWMTAWQIRHRVKGRVTPEKLLGRDRTGGHPGVSTSSTPAEIAAELDEIRKEWKRREDRAAAMRLEKAIEGS